MYIFHIFAGFCQNTPVVRITVVAPPVNPDIPVPNKNYMYAHQGEPIILECVVDNKPQDTIVSNRLVSCRLPHNYAFTADAISRCHSPVMPVDTYSWSANTSSELSDKN